MAEMVEFTPKIVTVIIMVTEANLNQEAIYLDFSILNFPGYNFWPFYL